jgi:hypothetical protein
MKFDSDTEIDRLLRRHARRTAASARATLEAAREASSDAHGAWTPPGAGGTHLDADEMNAYVEATLPDALRLRYLSHLSDCDECRHLVTKLALAANVQTESSEGTESVVNASSSWRAWLAALFSPPVLRFAVPAFALLAVVVVAFVALRPQRKDALVAQNEQSRTNQSRTSSASEPSAQYDDQAHTATSNTNATSTAEIPSAANSNAATGAASQANVASATSPAQKKETEANQITPAPQNEPMPTPSDSGGAFGRPTGERDEAKTMAKQQPSVAGMPATKAPRADTDKAVEESPRKSDDEVEKNKKPAPAAPSSNTTSDGVNLSVAESRGQANAKRAPESGRREGAARARSTSPQLSSEAAGADAKDERGGEIKSVGGRHFRRQGGTWVDTAYSPSRATVNVARRSEQYRALVADEPDIRAIADQLGGTVIVVWKNRAYRIY